MGSQISNQASDFDPRNYGFGKLSELAVAIDLFEIDARKTDDGKGKTIYLRRRKP